MEYKGTIMLEIIIIVCAISIGFASGYIFKDHDNQVEEAAEAVIERELNLPEGSIDFTPESKEVIA